MKLKEYLKQFSRNPKTRQKARWRSVYQKAQRCGVEVYKSNIGWLEDPEFLALKKEWGDTPGLMGDRVYFLFATARAIRHIAGDTVDVGVRYGSSSFYILKGLADASRQHHIFDSFEGLSAPTENDRSATDKKIFWKQGAIKVEEEVTRQCLSMFSNCHYYKGWVPDRFNEVADKRFAFVHIDVDLHQPTHDSLAFFYERLNSGGVMVCDDYGLTTCPGAKKAVDEFFAGKESVFSLPTGQSLVVKR